MPPTSFSSSPEYPRIMTSLWEAFTPFLVSNRRLSVCLCTCFVHDGLTPLKTPPPSLAGVLSVAGNGILLFVAYRKKSSLKPAEFFVVNLAISDLSMTMTLFPLAIPSAFTHMWGSVHVFFFYCSFAHPLCHWAVVSRLMRPHGDVQRQNQLQEHAVRKATANRTEILFL